MLNGGEVLERVIRKGENEELPLFAFGAFDFQAASDRDIRILNVDTNIERVISEEHRITSLFVLDDNKYLIVNLNSQEIHIWDVEGSWEKPLRYKGHRQEQYVIRSGFGGVNDTFIASGSDNFQIATAIDAACCC
ncbi:WD repeat-containing protein WDS [Tanacetum coccineum]